MISTQEFKEKFKDFFLKGKKGAEIGTIKNFMINGKSVPYIKTATGWKPYGTGKKMKKPEPEHEPREKKPEEIHEPREKKEEVEEAIRKKLQEYTSKATDNQLNAAINDPNQKEEVKDLAKKELEERQKNGSGGIKQITQTYVKVSDGQIIVKMNKDKTGYKGTKGSFKLESKEGESISDFKQRLKEEYEKFSAGQEQSEEKVVSLQQENKEDMKTKIKTQSDITSLLGLKEGESKELLFNSTVTITVKPKYMNEMEYTFKGIKASEQGGGKSTVTAIGIDMYNYLTWSEIPAKEKKKVVEKILESLDNDNKNTKEETNTGIKVEDFGDSTKELYEKTKENNSHLYTFVNKLIDSDFPKKDIFNFIKKEFDLGKVSSDFYADILGIKEENKTSDKPKEIKQITQTYLKVSDGQFIIKMNKDKTGYKATKGSFKLESKEGEDINDFKKRLKEEYEKSQQDNSQEESKQTSDTTNDLSKISSDKEFVKFTESMGYDKKQVESMLDLAKLGGFEGQELYQKIMNIMNIKPSNSEGSEIKKGDFVKFDSFNDYNKYQRERANISGEYESYISQERIERLLSYTVDSDMSLEIEEHINDFKEGKISAEDVLSMYSDITIKDRIYMNQKLIHEGLLPVVNGTIYPDYKGEKYLQFDMKDSESLDIATNIYGYRGEINFENATETQLYALGEYMGMSYIAIRDYNCGKELHGSPEFKNAIKNFSDSISQYIDQNRIEDNYILNRRMRLDEDNLNDEGINEWIQAKIGDIIEDKSFGSYSLGHLDQFGNSIQVTLLAKKGQAIANVNNDLEEYEYLSQKGSKFKVIDRGLNSIVVELVD